MNIKLLDLFQKTNKILSQVANMTASKLSLNQDSQIKTKSMELNFKKSKATDFDSNVKMSDGAIQLPPLCETIGLGSSSCEDVKLTSQVALKVYL